MNVYGELKKAIFELISSSTTTPAVTGRVYADTTTPTAAVPRFYNGSAWVQILTGQPTSLISQNSGKACTVDWSKGLYQQVILTDSPTISFINPQAGQVHTLVVTTAPLVSGLPVLYNYVFNMPDQDCRRKNYQPYGQQPSFGSQVYEWLYSSGIKPGYATVPVPYGTAYAALPNGLPLALSVDGQFGIALTASTPYNDNITFYDVQPQAQIAGYGYNLYGTPLALSGAAAHVCFSKDTRAVFFALAATPYVQGANINKTGVMASLFGNPATLPAGQGNGVDVHPSNTYVAVAHNTTPFMTIYPFTGQAFGTKLANPSTLPANNCYSIQFSPQGDYLAVATTSSPFLQVWAFNQNTGTIGSIASNPSTLPAGAPILTPQAIAWRPQGDFIAFAMGTTPYLYIVPFNRSTGTFGTALTVTATSNYNYSVAWTPDGQYLLVGCTTAPFLYVYDFSTGVPVSVSFDGSNPGNSIYNIVIHPNGEYAFLTIGASPFIIQQPLPQKPRNYLRINA